MNNTMTKPNYQLISSLTIGAIGMMFPIMANFIPPSNLRASCFIAGCILMGIAAIIEFDLYFLALQLVVLVGASLYFFNLSVMAKLSILAVVFLGMLVIFYRYHLLSDKSVWLGILGMSALAVGYGTAVPVVYLIGGMSIAVYSWISYRRGVNIAILWFILNAFFSIAAIYNLLHFTN